MFLPMIKHEIDQTPIITMNVLTMPKSRSTKLKMCIINIIVYWPFTCTHTSCKSPNPDQQGLKVLILWCFSTWCTVNRWFHQVCPIVSSHSWSLKTHLPHLIIKMEWCRHCTIRSVYAQRPKNWFFHILIRSFQLIMVWFHILMWSLAVSRNVFLYPFHGYTILFYAAHQT